MPTSLDVLLRVAITIISPPGHADAADEHVCAAHAATALCAIDSTWTIVEDVASTIVRSLSERRLRGAAHELPDVDHPELIDPFIDAALDAQTSHVPAALLTALAWGESRFDSSARPACGVLQVYPRDLGEPSSACSRWRRDLRAGVEAGVREIELMLTDKRVRGDMRRALLYRACGNSAFDGTCSATKHAWVAATILRWHALARHRLTLT